MAAARSGAPSPLPIGDIVTTHLATFAALDSLRQATHIPVDTDAFWLDVSSIAQ